MTATVKIGSSLEFKVEVANTEQRQRDGLRDRNSLPGGMLFPFSSQEKRQVWMAGMEIPIDIAWIADGKVLAVDSLTPCRLSDQSQCPRWTSPAPVDALLEVSAGALDGIKPGTPVTW